MSLSNGDVDDLRYAKDLLENPGLAAKITNLMGTPIEKGFNLLPEAASAKINEATKKALDTALHFAVTTMDARSSRDSSNTMHKLLVAAAGAGGGAFGLPGLPFELPVSTIIMLRSVADIARSEGENVKTLDTKLACVEVFALGGRTKKDDAAESGYFAVRLAMAHAVTDAARHIATKGLSQESAPAVVRFITTVAARFSIVVSEKATAQLVPGVGAAAGALINTMFIDHFQDMARGHFIVRRLERKYGPDVIKREYAGL